jgi:hypothetical protein
VAERDHHRHYQGRQLDLEAKKEVESGHGAESSKQLHVAATDRSPPKQKVGNKPSQSGGYETVGRVLEAE